MPVQTWQPRNDLERQAADRVVEFIGHLTYTSGRSRTASIDDLLEYLDPPTIPHAVSGGLPPPILMAAVRSEQCCGRQPHLGADGPLLRSRATCLSWCYLLGVVGRNMQVGLEYGTPVESRGLEGAVSSDGDKDLYRVRPAVLLRRRSPGVALSPLWK